MNDYNALTLAKLLNSLPEFMPPIVPPAFGESVPLDRMDALLEDARPLRDTEEKLFEVHRYLSIAYQGLGIYCDSVEGPLSVAPYLDVEPIPLELLSARQKVHVEGKESLKEHMASVRSWNRFQLAIAEFNIGGSEEDQSRLLVKLLSTGCQAVQGAVAALSLLGKAFTLAAACRFYILTLKGRLDLANDNDAAEKAAREGILAVISFHEKAASAMKKLSN
jgi:hypothetical protein